MSLYWITLNDLWRSEQLRVSKLWVVSVFAHALVVTALALAYQVGYQTNRSLEVVLVDSSSFVKIKKLALMASVDHQGGGHDSAHHRQDKLNILPNHRRGSLDLKTAKRPDKSPQKPQDAKSFDAPIPGLSVVFSSARPSRALPFQKLPKTLFQNQAPWEMGRDPVDAPNAPGSARAGEDTLEAYQRSLGKDESPTSIGAVEAAYIYKWIQLLEILGRRNYPTDPNTGKLLSGEVYISVDIKANGNLRRARLLRSSGNAILDGQALELVFLAAPFPPFPPSMRKEYAHIDIRKLWRFKVSNARRSR